MRGKLRPSEVHVPARGLIPARAGKTGPRARPSRRGRAHPRACGENASRSGRSSCASGSSPRVRGKPPWWARARGDARLIPARAGKTRRRGRRASGRWAHPRACGENRPFRPSAASLAGSSPRVRGKLLALAAPLGRGGLIPACAGKTLRCGSERSNLRAHPRVCGENHWAASHASAARGSSPRVRGKSGHDGRRRHRRRLIPARAGKTALAAWCPTGARAHPRVCGENSWAGCSGSRSRGSSPRVRGKRDRVDEVSDSLGLIPACAGKTRGRGRSAW